MVRFGRPAQAAQRARAHGRRVSGLRRGARVSGHFGAGPGCRVSGHLRVRERGRASGHFAAAGWVVFQKLWQSKNQSQNTAWGGLPNPPESTMKGVVVTPPGLVVTVTTRCKEKGGDDGHHRGYKVRWW